MVIASLLLLAGQAPPAAPPTAPPPVAKGTGQFVISGKGRAVFQGKLALEAAGKGRITIRGKRVDLSFRGFQSQESEGVTTLTGEGELSFRARSADATLEGEFSSIRGKGEGVVRLSGSGRRRIDGVSGAWPKEEESFTLSPKPKNPLKPDN